MTSDLADLPSSELYRKLQLEMMETERLRNLIHQREVDLRSANTEASNSARMLEAEKKLFGTQRTALEERVLQLETTNQQLQTQIQDKVAELEAANKRTTSLLSQQNQLQMSMKTLAYQAEVDTVTTIKEREEQMASRLRDLEEELAVTRSKYQEAMDVGNSETAQKAKESAQKLAQAERAMSQAYAERDAMKVERDLAITRAKEAESILEAKREALNDKMKHESDASKHAREAAAARVQREANITKALREEMQAELGSASVAASDAKREAALARRLQHEAEERLDPLIKQLDAAKLQLDSKTSALWAAEHALEVSSVEKLAILEDLDKYKIAAAKAAAQNEALRRSLMEELEAGSKYADRSKEQETEIEQVRENVRKAYEIVEEEAKKAERARAQAKRAKEFMENQMLQAKNLEQAYIQVKNAMKVMDIRFGAFADLPEEFAGTWMNGPPSKLSPVFQITESNQESTKHRSNDPLQPPPIQMADINSVLGVSAPTHQVQLTNHPDGSAQLGT
eukprot:CAMPEP_0114247978 /NCGR_PEP_ID=MMETSP0058-20121206/13317_1 /TAXON_ID=36894 /ORGANISM="Pyramimonas parkeae, CCMP726" /LENGTH=512 /DNA_ID=CAMNT_0001361333 /DNA_START=98 /DNA_END=1636 /DNA_ORIENTATION=-